MKCLMCDTLGYHPRSFVRWGGTRGEGGPGGPGGPGGGGGEGFPCLFFFSGGKVLGVWDCHCVISALGAGGGGDSISLSLYDLSLYDLSLSLPLSPISRAPLPVPQ